MLRPGKEKDNPVPLDTIRRSKLPVFPVFRQFPDLNANNDGAGFTDPVGFVDHAASRGKKEIVGDRPL